MQQEMLLRDEETMELRGTYTSLQQEVEVKTKKLKKVSATAGRAAQESALRDPSPLCVAQEPLSGFQSCWRRSGTGRRVALGRAEPFLLGYGSSQAECVTSILESCHYRGPE